MTVSLAATATAGASERASLVTVDVGRDRTVLPRLLEAGVDVADGVRADGRILAVVPAGGVDRLRATGLRVRVVRADVLAADARDRLADRGYRQRMGKAGSPLPSGRTTYRTLADIERELAALADQHPERVRRFALALRSSEGRAIQALEITDRIAAADHARKPVLLVDGVHHAREWPTAEITTEFATELARAQDKRIQTLLRRVRVVIVPVVNPDGYVNSRAAEGLDFAATNPDTPTNIPLYGLPPSGGILMYRRKTCSGDLPRGTPCELQFGVDPNRNYAYHWGGDGASSLPFEQDFRGGAPFSEPEVESMRRLSASVNAIGRVSLHTVAAKVLIPPSAADGKLPSDDEARLKAWGTALGEPVGYGVFAGPGLGYDTAGDAADFAYYAHHQLSAIVELGPAGGNFHGPYEESVVDQYFGRGPTAGRGIREGLLRTAGIVADPAQQGRLLVRTARPGTAYEVERSASVPTGAVCGFAFGLPGLLGYNTPLQCVGAGEVATVREDVGMRMTIGRARRATWSLPPSTPPEEALAGRTGSYAVFCTPPGGERRKLRDVVLRRGVRVRLPACA